MNIEARRRYWLRQLIASKYGKVADFSRETGENAGMISALLNEEQPKTFGERLARRLETVIGVAEGHLDREATSEPVSRARSERPQWTPVVGEARLGDGGFFEQTSYEPGTAGYVIFPRERDSYALYCKGNSMQTRINPGDYVVILPHRKPEVGSLVMCQTADGRRMIKTLGRTRDEMTDFLSANEEFSTITLDQAEITHVHYAIGPVTADFYQESPD